MLLAKRAPQAPDRAASTGTRGCRPSKGRARSRWSGLRRMRDGQARQRAVADRVPADGEAPASLSSASTARAVASHENAAARARPAARRRSRSGGVAQQRGERGRERLAVGLGEHGRAAAGLGQRPGGGGHHRRPAGHRLQHRQAEALVAGTAARTPPRRRRGRAAARRRRGRAARRPSRPASRANCGRWPPAIADLDPVGRQRARRGHERREVLARGVRGDAQHVRALEAERAARRTRVGGGREALVDAAGDDRRVDAQQLAQLAARELRHRDHPPRAAGDRGQHEPLPARRTPASTSPGGGAARRRGCTTTERGRRAAPGWPGTAAPARPAALPAPAARPAPTRGRRGARAPAAAAARRTRRGAARAAARRARAPIARRRRARAAPPPARRSRSVVRGYSGLPVIIRCALISRVRRPMLRRRPLAAVAGLGVRPAEVEPDGAAGGRARRPAGARARRPRGVPRARPREPRAAPPVDLPARARRPVRRPVRPLAPRRLRVPARVPDRGPARDRRRLHGLADRPRRVPVGLPRLLRATRATRTGG